MSGAGYGQFCPIAKAMEILGEKWTLLIVRELIMGGSRFNEMQRGLSQISPTLLTKRLHALEQQGLVIKRKIHGMRGYEYFPTDACRELMPVIEQIGHWGMRWARDEMSGSDFDLELLMLYLQRSIDCDKLPGNETVIRFNFSDVEDYQTWWLVVTDDKVDVCVHDPGKEVDVYFNVGLQTMCELWMGDISYKRAIADGRLELVGPAGLTRNVSHWLSPSIFAGIAPARQILEPA
ncbi:transcriptional regulator [Pseudomaricurvus alkylphenolicus]|jgi:DNA-binding HxlR family transcriptional regulator|uniref:winged helix-turn-helix transcriptional regulator n=1 Tax=Pseudomaricurvus alkylphenolicus TaxID=1306991 RepID=UPI0014208F57|nr:helix-turn-helix domain-containing protein [Pseudomaricurvus alkylphenolicus]NIB44702.1 transcriptional regulator [Pseudomaricurvus alkylphenolicus]